jgi:tetratricopeptide (TPR) repeat protein
MMKKIYLQYGTRLAAVGTSLNFCQTPTSAILDETILHLQKQMKLELDSLKNKSEKNNLDCLDIWRAEDHRKIMYLSSIISIHDTLPIKNKEEKLQYSRLYSERAMLYNRISMHKEAIEDETRAIQIDPDHSGCYYGRSSAYKNLGEYKKAIADLTKAIKNSSQSYDYYERANLYMADNKPIEAIADYTKAIELKSNHCYSGRGHAYMQVKNYSQAIKDYTAAIEKNKSANYMLCYRDRAFAYRAKGLELLKTNNDKAMSYLCLAWIDCFATLDFELPKKQMSLFIDELKKLSISHDKVEDFKLTHPEMVVRNNTLDAADEYYYKALNSTSIDERIAFMGEVIKIFDKFPPMNLVELNKYSQAYCVRGISYSAKHLIAEAAVDLEVAKNLSPRDIFINEEFDKISAIIKAELEKADKSYKEADAWSLSDDEKIALYTKAIKIFERFDVDGMPYVGITPWNYRRCYIERAKIYWAKNMFQQVIEGFSKASKQSSEDFTWWEYGYIGVSYFEIEKAQEAISNLTKAMELAPNNLRCTYSFYAVRGHAYESLYREKREQGLYEESNLIAKMAWMDYKTAITKGSSSAKISIKKWEKYFLSHLKQWKEEWLAKGGNRL